jgi:hypothetical protein
MRHKASFHIRAEIILYVSAVYEIQNLKSEIENDWELSTPFLSGLVGSCRDHNRHKPTIHTPRWNRALPFTHEPKPAYSND